VEFTQYAHARNNEYLLSMANVACGFYDYNEDIIGLNMTFTDKLGRDITALHELVHWTGHVTRLSRPSLCVDNDYEETVAYMGAAMLGLHLGLYRPDQMNRYVDDAHAHYGIGSTKLTERDAWAAVKYLLTYKQGRVAA
jgi:antirestriction protein ArdC